VLGGNPPAALRVLGVLGVLGVSNPNAEDAKGRRGEKRGAGKKFLATKAATRRQDAKGKTHPTSLVSG